MELGSIKEIVLNWILNNGIKIAIIIVLALAADCLLSCVFTKLKEKRDKGYEEQDKKINTLFSIFYSTLKITIIIVALLSILEVLHIDIKPILAAAGVLGVAVGFGSQRLVEDVISGILIILNRQIRLGDVVTIGDKTGYVEKFTLNMVVLRDLEGRVHYIRNGKIDIVTNMTQSFSYYVTDISVAYKEDIEHVIFVIKQVGEKLRAEGETKEDIIEPIEVCGLDKFDDSAIVIKVRIKTKPVKQWAVGREFNLFLKKEFDKQGIEIPFPQRCVYIKKDE